MTKYARKSGANWIDVYRVPENFADLATLNRCLPGGGFTVVDDALQHGALHNNGDGSSGTYTNPKPEPEPAPATPQPLSLSKTAFRAHCVANLGGGATGILRFQEILDALEGGSGVLKFCFGEYTGATVFDKDKTNQFLDLIVSVLHDGEHAAIINNWPEA